MADTPNIPNQSDETPEEFYPQEEMEVEQPRRAASAEFVVEGQAGSTAVMREAMDPANQSLADALRLSYRVLQVVMVILIALFLVSGFETIDDDQSGVMLRFGRIVEVGGEASLEPGMQQSWLPYSAGEFVLFQVTNLTIGLDDVFWPRLRPGESTDEAKERIRDSDPIVPTKSSGSVLAQGGDIAHVQLSASYEIFDPAKFVTLLQPGSDGHQVVRLALQSATVESMASMELEGLLDRTAETKDLILRNAQQMLDDLDTGIQLQELSLTRVQPALAIVKAFEEVQEARVQAENTINSARRTADETLLSTAGSAWPELFERVDEYKNALALGNEDEAEAVLAALNTKLQEDPGVGGEVSEIIRRAESYQSEIETTLGRDARRYASLVNMFERNPQLTVLEQWQRTMSRVFSVRDAERVYIPAGLAMMRLNVNALNEVAQLRRRAGHQAAEQEQTQRTLGGRLPFIQGAGDVNIGRAGRQLEIGEGSVRGTAAE